MSKKKDGLISVSGNRIKITVINFNNEYFDSFYNGECYKFAGSQISFII